MQYLSSDKGWTECNNHTLLLDFGIALVKYLSRQVQVTYEAKENQHETNTALINNEIMAYYLATFSWQKQNKMQYSNLFKMTKDYLHQPVVFIAIIIFSEDMYLKPKETAKRDDILIFLHDKLNLQTTTSRRRVELF